ncbi:hypothetical protein L1987_19823 [Smallanthus sonchifolius]|uniref:Uncharacterized protein n=1 Tax=Smallanthus sonchifolius TaxID=185202 RepID=A0ACB9IQV8_9ASTR|nr:hypothetical protein L1987_19823 [Smallanthus sonchifolius]
MTKTKLIFGLLVVVYASITYTYAADTVSANQTVRYKETIVSRQETFELGFFSPGNSTNHYIGIWYKKLSYRTVVWVANRNTPLTHDTSGELTLTLQGVLIVRDTTTGNVLWSSANSSRASVRNPISQLLDTGNFIIYEEGDEENPIWQSFDYITDNLLPGMNYGRNLVTGVEWRLTSWKSDDDPASGEFSFGIDTRGYPQVVLTDGPNIKFRGGPWNGLRYTGYPNLRPNDIYNFTFVLNQKEIYYQYKLITTSVLTRVVLHPNGDIERLLWSDSEQEWKLYLAPHNDQYSSKGCQRTIPLDCGPGEGFNKYSNLKLPDTQSSWYNQAITLVECEKKCKSNCSCNAYSNLNISRAGSGCLLWFGDLIDIRTGYMAPEYAGDGIFSIKSDVYSFGVLVLEIVCGEKNRGFVHKQHCNNLIRHAWGLHNEDRSLQLVDKSLGESINVDEMMATVGVRWWSEKRSKNVGFGDGFHREQCRRLPPLSGRE